MGKLEQVLLCVIFVIFFILGAFVHEAYMHSKLIEMEIAEYNSVTGDWQYKAEYRIIK